MPLASRVHGPDIPIESTLGKSYRIDPKSQKETTFFLSNYPCSRSCIQTLANMAKRRRKTHGTLCLVHRLAQLFQVGHHHCRLGAPSSFNVTFYLPTALSPSLHSFKVAHLNCLPYRPRIPNVSLNVLCTDYFHLFFSVP